MQDDGTGGSFLCACAPDVQSEGSSWSKRRSSRTSIFPLSSRTETLDGESVDLKQNLWKSIGKLTVEVQKFIELIHLFQFEHATSENDEHDDKSQTQGPSGDGIGTELTWFKFFTNLIKSILQNRIYMKGIEPKCPFHCTWQCLPPSNQIHPHTGIVRRKVNAGPL